MCTRELESSELQRLNFMAAAIAFLGLAALSSPGTAPRPNWSVFYRRIWGPDCPDPAGMGLHAVLWLTWHRLLMRAHASINVAKKNRHFASFPDDLYAPPGVAAPILGGDASPGEPVHNVLVVAEGRSGSTLLLGLLMLEKNIGFGISEPWHGESAVRAGGGLCGGGWWWWVVGGRVGG